MEDAALSLERTISGEDQRLEGLVRVTTVDSLAAHPDRPPQATSGCASGHRNRADHRQSIAQPRPPRSRHRRSPPSVDAHETVVRKIGEMAFAVHASPAYLAAHGTPDWAAGAPGYKIVRIQDDLLDTPDGRWFSDRTT